MIISSTGGLYDVAVVGVESEIDSASGVYVGGPSISGLPESSRCTRLNRVLADNGRPLLSRNETAAAKYFISVNRPYALVVRSLSEAVSMVISKSSGLEPTG
jgi:hypothetical protein